MTRKIRYSLEYAVVKCLVLLVNLLPYRLALVLGDLIGFLAFSIFRVRRRVTLENLKKSFGDKYTRSEYRKIGARAYANMARGMVEYGMFPSFRRRGFPETLTMDGRENLRKMKEAGKGAVLVTGHFGSWELMGAYLAQEGWPIDYLVGEQHNLKVNRLLNEHRRMFGIGLIEMGVAARGVIRALRNGRMVAMLSDQDAGSDGVIVNFLGRSASTPKGPAAFAIKTGCPLACGFIVRNGAHQRIIIEPPFEFSPTGDKDEDIKRLTQAYTSLLGEYVKEYPDHWFWPHRRWKSTR